MWQSRMRLPLGRIAARAHLSYYPFMDLNHIYSGDVAVRAVSQNSLSTRLHLNAKYQSRDFQEWLMTRLAVGPGEHVLDVGCGNGAQSIPFLNAVGPTGSVSSCDVSAESIEVLLRRTEGDPRLQAVTADMAELSSLISDQFRQKSFTLAHSSYALYYSPQRDSVLRTMAQSMHSSGRVAVFTPMKPHGMVDLAAQFSDIPDAVYDSLSFPDHLQELFRELFWDVRIDLFQSEMRVTSVDDFMDFYKATTYYSESAEDSLRDYAIRSLEGTGAVTYEKNGFLIQGRSLRL